MISDELPTEHGRGVSGRISSSAFGCGGGERKTRCQARVLASVEIPELPEWVGMIISQSAGNKMVTCVENANYRVGSAADADTGCHGGSVEYANQRYQEFGMHRVWDALKSGRAAPAGINDAQGGLTGAPLADSLCRAKAVELIAFLNTKVHASYRLGGGGTSALTPTLSRSGEGEFSAASVRCGSLGLSCGSDGDRGLGGAAAKDLGGQGRCSRPSEGGRQRSPTEYRSGHGGDARIAEIAVRFRSGRRLFGVAGGGRYWREAQIYSV